MKLLLLSLLVAFSMASRHHHKLFETGENKDAKIYAVLVAGSNGWSNYRHQADVCHSYQVLTAHGVPRENIITMMYDDIAYNPLNSNYTGKIFNKPGRNARDVYHGVKIDYKGSDVTPENFLNVLDGNSAAMDGVGTGRVLPSGPNDNVFVYFSDHGAPNLIAFPEDILHARQLVNALTKMHRENKFAKLVFYMEACESGSMFDMILPEDAKIYAITAANDHESSYAVYCENKKHLPCLGDLFSVSWLQDSDTEVLQRETLYQQYLRVKEETNTSHVMHFGDMTIAQEPVADFQGHIRPKAGDDLESDEEEDPSDSAWPVGEIPLLSLKQERRRASTHDEKRRITKEIHKLHNKRRHLDEVMTDIVDGVIHDVVNRRRILNDQTTKLTHHDCYEGVTNAYHKACFHLTKNPYALRRLFVLKNLCEERIEQEIIVRQIMDTCATMKRPHLGPVE